MQKAWLEKMKTDKKTRNTVICAGVGALIVIVAAVAIPIGVHAQGVKKATAAQEAVSAHESLTAEQVLTEPQTTEPTTEAPKETIPETTATATVTENTTAKKSASKNSGSSGSAKKSTSSSTTKKSNSFSKSSGSSGNSGSKGSAANTTGRDWCDYTQAEVNAIIAECRAYGESRGLVWEDSYTLDNNGWRAPAQTVDYTHNIEDNKRELTADMKGAIDRCVAMMAEYDSMPGAGFKIYAERVANPGTPDGKNNPYYWWKFYLM